MSSEDYMLAEERLIERGIAEDKITPEMIEEEVKVICSDRVDQAHELIKDQRYKNG